MTLNQLFPRFFGLALAVTIVWLPGCQPKAPKSQNDGALNAVATTNLVGDLVQSIGGERVNVTSLMGPGVDPHLYKAKAGDVARLSNAEIIFYGGLHLEGKMVELFEQMAERGRPTIAVTDGCDKQKYIESKTFGGNYDPHVWFDVSLWKCAAQYVADVLTEADPAGDSLYAANVAVALAEMDSLTAYILEQANRLPAERRILVTSHDAFGYFGRAYGFEVRGLQGLSTETEAGTGDVQRLAAFVHEKRLPALFIESSVSPRGIEAVMAAVNSKGFDVKIGGDLFSDALGEPDSPEGSYVGMFKYNVDTIVGALLSEPEN